MARLSHTSGVSGGAIAAVFVTIASMLVPASAFSGASVDGVRCAVRSGYTRVVIDLGWGASPKYKVATHTDPDRIAVNITGFSSKSSVSGSSVGDGGVRRTRVNRLSWGTQVVIDLQGAADWTDFVLPPDGDLPQRIVVDVRPRGDAPPRTRQAVSQDASRALVVAIDPGHGGRDPGTMGGKGLVEKKLVLDIAHRVTDRINEAAGVRAFLTRTTDIYLTLPRRNEIAIEKQADVFVSIHLNAAKNRSARGAEIFFLSPAGAARTARGVLSNPNRAAQELGLEGQASADLLHMLVDVNQQSVLARSELLAESILESFNKARLMPTRSVKQKSFLVLRTISMPSVLVEAGFLTNRSDAKLISTPEGRDRIARQIAAGIIDFLDRHPPPRHERGTRVVHTVQRGDTLWKLSRRYGATIASIREDNRLGSSSVLHVGQELVISRGY